MSELDLTESLRDALKRSQPARVRRVGADEIGVLLTPRDITRRNSWLARGRTLAWNLGRSNRYFLGHETKLAGQQLAYGIAAGDVAFPDKCAICLDNPAQGVVWEVVAGLLPGGSARWSGASRRVLTASNFQRIWYSVPFCAAHARRPGGVAFGETMFDVGWVAFRNRDYGREFGELNGIAPRGVVRRWWASLVLIAVFLMVIGVGSTVAELTADPVRAADVLGTVVFLMLGIALSVYLYATLVAPWRVSRYERQSGTRDMPRATGRRVATGTTGLHHDRGDGYCGHCFEPWPCSSTRGL